MLKRFIRYVPQSVAGMIGIFRSRTCYCNLSDRNNECLHHTLQKQQKPCRIPLEKNRHSDT